MGRKRKQSRAPGLKVRWRKGIAYAIGTLPGYDKPIRRSLRATSQADADAACIALQSKLLKDCTEKTDAGLTFAEAAAKYLAGWEQERKRRTEARGGRYRFSYPHYKRILAKIGHMPVAEIDTGFITALSEELLPTQSPQSRGRQIVAAVVSTINYCAKRSLCAPVRGVKEDDGREVKKVYVSREWLDKFVSAARELTKNRSNEFADSQVYTRIAAAAVFMYMTGARLGEVRLWLNVEHFDLDARKASLPPEFLKNDKRRTYLLPRELVMLLREIKPDEGNMFRLPSDTAVYERWKQICEKAKIQYVPPHQAGRHSFGTNVGARVGKDIDIATATELGGWEDKEVFLNTYVHPSKDLLASVDEIFEKPKGGLKSVKGGKD